MKKSTLITTIAMIVVVVVALSTATYAWFTSDSKTYATQTISTQAAADIVVLANDTRMLTTSTKANFATNTLLTYTIGSGETEADLGIRKGLWAPTSEIATVASGSNSSTDSTSSAIVKFIAGTQSSDGVTFKVGTVPTDTSADMVRVTSMKSGTIDLTIYIGAKNNEASKFAAQGVSFYLADSSAKIANTAYSYFNTEHTGYDMSGEMAQNNTCTIAKSFDAVGASGTITYNATAAAASAIINHRSTSTTPGTNFETAATDDAAEKAGISHSTYPAWYSMTISLGAFTQNQSKNFIIYNWLDGAYLTDAAGSAEIAISYAFAYHTA